MDPQALYTQIGRLIEDLPDLRSPSAAQSKETMLWLGRAKKLVEATLDPAQRATFAVACQDAVDRMIHDAGSSAQKIRLLLYEALATAEMNAPVQAQGAFIHAGNAFDAMASVGKVLETASNDVLIVDPYMDEMTLTDFAPLAKEGVMIRLLADKKHHKPTFQPAVRRWETQYKSARPIRARLAPPRALHDRAIFLDGSEAWTLTQSLNAFADRSPASIIRVAPEPTTLKIAAYNDLWNNATPI